MDPRNHYRALEIDRSATLEEAKQAYRDLIAVWHPDRYTHNPRLQAKAVEKMKTLNAAFEVVSRHILENGSDAGRSRQSQPATTPFAVRDTKSRSGKMDRAAAWAQTEARLEALARARKIVEARKAARAQKSAAAAGQEEIKTTTENRAPLDTVNRSRVEKKAAADKTRLEQRLSRERAWAATEQKLRALKLAKEKAAAKRAAGLSGNKESREPIRGYVKQVLIGSGILLLAFSGNAVQAAVRLTFTAELMILGIGLLAWWVSARVKGADREKK